MGAILRARTRGVEPVGLENSPFASKREKFLGEHQSHPDPPLVSKNCSMEKQGYVIRDAGQKVATYSLSVL